MIIETKILDKAGVVTLSGRMDADRATAFEEACHSLLAGGATHLVVDVAGLGYISSLGIRSLLSVAKAREAAGAHMVLANLGGFVKQVLDVTRLTPLFRVADSVDAAVQSLR